MNFVICNLGFGEKGRGRESFQRETNYPKLSAQLRDWGSWLKTSNGSIITQQQKESIKEKWTLRPRQVDGCRWHVDGYK